MTLSTGQQTGCGSLCTRQFPNRLCPSRRFCDFLEWMGESTEGLVAVHAGGLITSRQGVGGRQTKVFDFEMLRPGPVGRTLGRYTLGKLARGLEELKYLRGSARQERLGRPRLRAGLETRNHAAFVSGGLDESQECAMGSAKKKFFAVARGRKTGVFLTWPECERQVKGFQNNLYKGFASETEAGEFLKANGVEMDGSIEGRDALTGDKVQDGEEQTSEGPMSCERALMFFDGASKRNPGDAGFGAVIFDRDSADTEDAMRVIREVKGYMPQETNNVAEYSGLIAGLAACLEIGVRDVLVKGDSKLVINQVNNEWKVKNENLMRYHRVARMLVARFQSFEAVHVYRERNTYADRLSNEACVERRVWCLEMVEGEGEGGSAKRKREEA